MLAAADQKPLERPRLTADFKRRRQSKVERLRRARGENDILSVGSDEGGNLGASGLESGVGKAALGMNRRRISPQVQTGADRGARFRTQRCRRIMVEISARLHR